MCVTDPSEPRQGACEGDEWKVGGKEGGSRGKDIFSLVGLTDELTYD